MRGIPGAGVLPVIPDWLSGRLGSKITVLAVDDDGIEVSVRGPDRVVDVLFDGRRIWSFWVLRDTTPRHGLRRVAAWPDRMRRFLDGHTRLTVRDHVAEETLFEEERAFGTGTERIAFLNRSGLEISLDKSGRFSPTFSVRSADHLEPLLDAMQRTIAVLAERGLTGFPAWGSLLGAVREQNLLGHDSDADLSYISKATTPVDVVRESFDLQRLLHHRGFETYRYSGAAFRIQVLERDGAKRGLDLFAAFYDHGTLYVTGEVGTEFREEWLFPFGTCRIADREFPAPARPDKLLEAMYGPTWRVPDPAFQFNTPEHIQARLNDWFRGLSPFRREWEAELAAHGTLAGRPSDLARLLHAEVPSKALVVEVGIGRGEDALWLARRGHAVVGYDYASQAGRVALRKAAARGLDLTKRRLSLTELRSVLGEGALMSRRPGPKALLARHLLDATTRFGRRNLVRFASMTLRGGGRLYAEFWTGQGEGGFGLRPVALDEVVELVESYGGTIVSAEELLNDGASAAAPTSIGRVIAEWT
ncbi:class I SAM-dependent methyltransferase [Nocardioides dongkuii]|uniref:class I SAM-dependent methyltransferase n=1 Tax=Nocardioides dongkuii TaxID=2760089 RepID=UPI0018775082|nr:class I SAM-dependent methyltransferase [Nocardioides dongkuii]